MAPNLVGNMNLWNKMATTNCKEESTEHQPLIDIGGFLSSPQDNHVISSSVPAVCLEEETLMGIDEAGRGPVLGKFIIIYICLLYNYTLTVTYT